MRVLRACNMHQGRAEKGRLVHLILAALAPFEPDSVTGAAVRLPCPILLLPALQSERLPLHLSDVLARHGLAGERESMLYIQGEDWHLLNKAIRQVSTHGLPSTSLCAHSVDSNVLCL